MDVAYHGPADERGKRLVARSLAMVELLASGIVREPTEEEIAAKQEKAITIIRRSLN